jgi:hypothetical protein
MGNQAAWLNTPHSDSRMNMVTAIPNTGTVLAALDKTKHKLLICTASGSGLILDHVYLCNEAGDALIDITTGAPHTHSSSTDGGELVNLFIANSKFFDLSLTKTNDLITSGTTWNKSITSTGTIADDTDGTTGERSIKLLTGATSGSGSTITYPHLVLNFAKRSLYQFKCRFSATTALAFHSGIQADDVIAADSNARKYNAEVCTVTNTNWFLRTATGSANSTSDTGTAFTTNRAGIRIEHYPDLGTPRADMYIDAGTVFQKTTNIPTSGVTADNNLIKHSLKNSAAADKNLFMYGCRLRYTVSDEWA